MEPKDVKYPLNPEFPEIIEINGEKFQVIGTSMWIDREEDGSNINRDTTEDKEDEEMVIELVKIVDKPIAPDFRLTYPYHEPNIMKFFTFDKQSNKWKGQEITFETKK